MSEQCKPSGTYQQALQALISAVREYKGEPVPPHEGETEHPLHLAVRNVERWFHWNTERGRGPLPDNVWPMWIAVLAASRDYTNDGKYRLRRAVMIHQHHIRNMPLHPSSELSSEEPDRPLAVAAAYDLASWAMSQLEMPEPDGNGIGHEIKV